MIYHNQNKDHYPEMSARERVIWTKRFIAMSGPAYQDVSVTIGARTRDRFRPEHMSHASWCILQAAEVGETVVLKIRCDEAADKA